MARFGIPSANRNPLAYQDVRYSAVPTIDSPRDPTVNDVHPIQTIWRNSQTLTECICVGFVNGEAQWRCFIGSSAGPLLSIETDDGPANVIPDASGVVQILGGAGVEVTGQGPGNTVTVSLTGGGTALDQINVDFNTAPGTDPVLPDGTGQINHSGNVVTNGTNANAPVATHSRAVNTYQTDVQLATTLASAPGDPFDVGLASFDAQNYTIDGNGFQSLINVDNIIYVGKHGNDTNDGKNIEAAKLTIAAALTAATSGDVIYICPGTYTENLTLVAGVNLVGIENRTNSNNTIIVGKLSASYSGNVTIQNLYLKTNGDYAIETTGANATLMRIENCYLEATDNNVVNHTSSNSSSDLSFEYCRGAYLGNYSFFTSICPAGIAWRSGEISTTNLTTAKCAISAGAMTIAHSRMGANFTFTSTGYANWSFSQIGSIGQTAATINGTGNNSVLANVFINSQNATAISIGAGATLDLENSIIDSNIDAAISVTGTLNYSNVMMFGTNSNITGGTQDTPSYNQMGSYLAKTQPAFLAYNSTTATNQTGNGAAVTAPCNTEIFDANGDYNDTTYTFTAPITGKYHFEGSVFLSNISSMETFVLDLITSHHTYRTQIPNAIDSNRSITISTYADMDTLDTAYLQITVSGGAGDTASIVGTNTTGGVILTKFSGKLVS